MIKMSKKVKKKNLEIISGKVIVVETSGLPNTNFVQNLITKINIYLLIYL
jgi:hypothetical protein